MSSGKYSRLGGIAAGVGVWLGMMYGAWTASAANPVWNGFTYSVTNGEVTINARQASTNHLEIPAEIDGKPVRILGHKAFAERRDLRSVDIPDSVRQIGAQAFERCSGMTNARLGRGVERISDGAFSECNELKEARLPEGLLSLGSGAFQKCHKLTGVALPASLRTLGDNVFPATKGSLTVELAPENESFTMQDGVLFDRAKSTVFLHSLRHARIDYVIPAGVTRIAGGAFQDCRNLRRVTIPTTVTDIGDNAFFSCEKLEQITLPEGVTQIGVQTFNGCRSLTNVVFGCAVTNIRSMAFFGCASLKRITIPDSVIVLGDSAFSECRGLEDVTLGDGVERLGTYVFGSCGVLTRLRLPDSVKRIGDNAFWNSGITNIVLGSNVSEIGFVALSGIPDYVVAESNPNYRSWQGVLFSRDMTSLIRYPPARRDAKYEVPDGVTTIGPSAFAEATRVKSCRLPPTVTNIADYAFRRSGLETIALPDNLTALGMCAFAGCEVLREVTSLGRIETLPPAVFLSCSSLTRLTLPATLTRIENGLDGFRGLAELTVADGNQSFRVLDGVLFNRAMTELVLYPPKRPGAEYRVPDGVTDVGAGAFADAAVLQHVSLSAAVTNIGPVAFQRAAIKSIAIPAGIRKIGRCAFGYCPQLATVLFEGDALRLEADTLAYTPATLFYREGAQGWTNESICGRPVRGISSDQRFQFSVGNGQTVCIQRHSGTSRTLRVPAMLAGLPVTTIGVTAFASNAGLTSVMLPAGVTGVASRAFASCTNLSGVFFDGDAPMAASDVFENSSATVVCRRLDTQGWGLAFGGRSVTVCSYDSGLAFVPDSESGMALFRCLDTNRAVVVPAEVGGKPVVTILPQAFMGCREMTQVSIPAGVRRIGAGAFEGCYRLANVIGPTQDADMDVGAFSFCYSLTNALVGGRPQGGSAGDGVPGGMRLRLHLVGGDLLTGTGTLREVSLQIDDSRLTIPMAHVVSIRPGIGDAPDVVRLGNGDLLEGTFEPRRIEVKGDFGITAIELRKIANLEVLLPGGGTRAP